MIKFTVTLAILASILITGCKKDEKEPMLCCTMVATTVDIRIFDKSGNDMMSSDNINQVWPFKILYPRTNNSGGFLIEKHPIEGYTYLRVTMDSKIGLRKTITLVQLGNKTTADTLETQWQDSPSNLIPEKIWHNGNLVWQGNSEREFEITLP